MGNIVLTYGFITLNDILTEDTDQATNPWLELILESNKNTKAPTAYWNAMQNALIQYEFWPKVENYSHSLKNVLKREEVEKFYRKMCDADLVEVIDFNRLELADVNFNGANFCRDVQFISTKFLDDVSFAKANFHGTVRFDGGKFSGVNFDAAQFFAKALFSSLAFKQTATFRKTKFHGSLWFGSLSESDQKTNFQRQAFFTKAQFHKIAIFNEVLFSNGCDFQNAEFCDIIYFDNCECRGGTGLTGGKLNFAGANVEFILRLRAFRGPVNFRGTNFVNRPPELFGSDLKPDSDLAFTLPAKPNPYHINIYEDLRQHAERLGKLEEKKRFVHAELSCRAIDPQKPSAERFVWWLYYITSDYGTSIYRPLGWLFVLFLISAVPWAGYAIWFSPMSVWSALSYNILQAVPFTGHLSSALLNNFPELPMSLHFIAGPVALLNPIFWFLIGLGMRYKLRLAR